MTISHHGDVPNIIDIPKKSNCKWAVGYTL